MNIETLRKEFEEETGWNATRCPEQFVDWLLSRLIALSEKTERIIRSAHCDGYYTGRDGKFTEEESVRAFLSHAAPLESKKENL